MKTFLILMLLFGSCSSNDSQLIALSVLADRTEPKYIPVPTIEAVWSLCGLNDNSTTGLNFSFQNIGNTDYNTRYVAQLEPYSILGNSLQRQADVKKLQKKIDTLITQQNLKEYDFQNSNIFLPLVKELEVLSSTPATKKVLLLYSDLSEYSDVFNVYESSERKLLLREHEKVVMQFRSFLNTPDLSGIDLYIIYYPKTPAQNRLFQNLCKVYKEVFNGTGLTIYIGIDKQLKNE